MLDKATGEALVGANVVVANTNLGAAADIDGKFELFKSMETLKISYVGYNATTVDITMTANATIDQDFRLVAGNSYR